MANVAELQEWKVALEAAFYAGERVVQSGDKKVEYRTGSEMAAALSDLNRQINQATGASVGILRVATSKGL